ncbi:MAG: SH3 domain-containing protein [Chloroflexi bacterium]|nr:SH3 domain-containing protein [Chloroflexota bacterium]MCC6896081.1 hypothetical protein [Anaerolineae bacterium]
MYRLRASKPHLVWFLLAFCLGTVPFVTAQSASACALPPRLTIGQRGQVIGTSPNNLRAAPARSADLIGMIDGGGLFTVLAGAACDPTSGINWWQVDYAGQTGWTAEGDSQNYFVEPINPALLYRTDELVTGAGEEGRADLALVDLVTGENRVLTTNIPQELSAGQLVRLGMFAWTPAGDKIAFTAEIYEPFIRTIDQSVYLMNPDGSGKCLLAEDMTIIENGLYAVMPSEPTESDGAPLDFPTCENPSPFLPSGYRFMVEPVQIGVAFNQTTGDRIQLTDRTIGDALYGSRVSPDQTTAALVLSDKDYHYSLFLTPLANPQPQLVTLDAEPTTALGWSPDSQSLLVATQDDLSGIVLLVRINAVTGEQTVIYEGETYGYDLSAPVWSPSGEQIAFSIGTEAGEPHLTVMNADGSDLRQLDTPISHGQIVWRPE